MRAFLYLFVLVWLFPFHSAFAYDASVYLAPSIGADSDIAQQVAKAIRDNYSVKTKILTSDCTDTSCQVIAAGNTSAEVLLTFDITNMMGFYVADIRVYDISNSNAEIASAEAEGDSLATLTENTKEAVMGLAKERFVGIQQREITLQKQIELNTAKKEEPKEAVVPSGTSHFSIGQRKGWEISPFLGAELNNPVLSTLGAGLRVSKSFSDSLAFEGFAFYGADLGLRDIKDLTTTLVQIANSGSNVEFLQPIDKIGLAATGGVRWIPIRAHLGQKNKPGNIKFDVYGSAGLGIISTNLYYATYDEVDLVQLSTPMRQIRIPLTIGYGINFHISPKITLDIGARNILWQGIEPQYDPDYPRTEKQWYRREILHIGVTMLQKGFKYKKVTTPFRFQKLGRGSDWPKQRFEAGLGMVTNDPFLSLKLINLSYIRYLKENLSLHLDLGYSPDFGDSDWKPLTMQLVTENSVSPDISKIRAIGSCMLGFEPFLFVSKPLKGTFGFRTGYGVIQTFDDLSALQAEGDPRAESTQEQLHSGIVFGPYLTILNKDFGTFGLYLDNSFYIETIDGTTLEMKNNQILKIQYTIPLGIGG